jgi:hypothetical protein
MRHPSKDYDGLSGTVAISGIESIIFSINFESSKSRHHDICPRGSYSISYLYTTYSNHTVLPCDCNVCLRWTVQYSEALDLTEPELQVELYVAQQQITSISSYGIVWDYGTMGAWNHGTNQLSESSPTIHRIRPKGSMPKGQKSIKKGQKIDQYSVELGRNGPTIFILFPTLSPL